MSDVPDSAAGRCLVCDSNVEPFIRFGPMPIANRFLARDEFDGEFFFELAVCFCDSCFVVQLAERVPPEMMFNEEYAYFSSISTVMVSHFEDMAQRIRDIVSREPDPFVVELGCNDGIMLRHLAAAGIRHVGIEPSANVAEAARVRGVSVLERFFDLTTARFVRQHSGQADVICGANVMCHIEDINSVFEGIAALLKPSGVLFFEDPYLLDIVRKTSFDQIYDEHVFYFSGLSIAALAERHGLELVDMAPQAVHGGSMRYYIRHRGAGTVSERVHDAIAAEKARGLGTPGGYVDFRSDVARVAGDLRGTLQRMASEGHRVAGYGATSKSTTLYNYAKIGPELLAYVTDTTPTKIGKYTPGAHIPIKSHQHFCDDNPPFALLLAWNHKDEILAKERAYRERGGKFITYFPRLTIE